MSIQDYSEAFSGLYLAPGYYMGSDREAYRAYLKHLKTMLNPTTVEEHRLIGAWATLQWRFQCLTTTERDCWESYELAMDAMNPLGESSMLDMDPFERMALGFKAIRAWERLVKLDARLQREEARLLPLLEALLARAEKNESPGMNDVNVPSEMSEPHSWGPLTGALPPGIEAPSSQHLYRSVGGKREKTPSVRGLNRSG